MTFASWALFDEALVMPFSDVVNCFVPWAENFIPYDRRGVAKHRLNILTGKRCRERSGSAFARYLRNLYFLRPFMGLQESSQMTCLKHP